MASVVIDLATGVALTSAIKAPCLCATTANITLSGLQTIDGVSVSAGDRVLVKNQTNAVTNGIWTADTGPWTRAPDFDSVRDVTRGIRVFVLDGSSNQVSSWYLSTENPVPGTSSISFVQEIPISSPTVATATSIPNVTIPSPITAVYVLGYSVPGVGGGMYKYTATTPAHTAYFTDAAGRKFELAEPILTPQMVGAKGDNNGTRGNGTDDTMALVKWFNTVAITKRKGFIPAAHYRVAQQMLWDVGVQSSTSPAFMPIIEGAGEGGAVFMVDSGVASPCIHITNSTGWTTSAQRPVFYGAVKGFTIEASRTSGIALLIGDGDRLGSGGTSCYFNGTEFGPMVVANRAASTDSIAVLASGLVDCRYWVTANGGGVPASHGGGAAGFYGIAHQFQDCTMTSFGGSAGNARIGVYLTDTGSIFGNRFETFDWEVLGTCIKCDAVNSQNNKITGGTTTLCDYIFDVTRGYGLEAENHLIGDVRLEIIKNHDDDTDGTFGGRGLVLKRMHDNLIGMVRNGSFWDSGPGGVYPGSGSAVPVQPTLTRNTWIRNRWGQDAIVTVFSNMDASLEVYKRSWSDTSSGGSRVVIGPITCVPVKIKAGESIKIPTSAASASWYWEAA